MSPCTLFLLLILGIGQGQTTNNFIQTLATKNIRLKNVIFPSNPLFETEAASVVSCAVRCSLRGQCASFAFTPFSSSSSSSSSASSRKGICKGHTTVMTADDVSVPSPGSVLFVPHWLQKACTDNTQCLTKNSECFADTCLCTPGYYYSNSQLSCLDNCSLADLHSTFLAYPGWGIKEHNLQVISGLGLSQCRDNCSATALCRTFDLAPASGDCYLQDVSARDAPAEWRVYSNLVNYQKTCL